MVIFADDINDVFQRTYAAILIDYNNKVLYNPNSYLPSDLQQSKKNDYFVSFVLLLAFLTSHCHFCALSRDYLSLLSRDRAPELWNITRLLHGVVVFLIF